MQHLQGERLSTSSFADAASPTDSSGCVLIADDISDFFRRCFVTIASIHVYWASPSTRQFVLLDLFYSNKWPTQIDLDRERKKIAAVIFEDVFVFFSLFYLIKGKLGILKQFD